MAGGMERNEEEEEEERGSTHTLWLRLSSPWQWARPLGPVGHTSSPYQHSLHAATARLKDSADKPSKVGCCQVAKILYVVATIDYFASGSYNMQITDKVVARGLQITQQVVATIDCISRGSYNRLLIKGQPQQIAYKGVVIIDYSAIASGNYIRLLSSRSYSRMLSKWPLQQIAHQLVATIDCYSRGSYNRLLSKWQLQQITQQETATIDYSASGSYNRLLSKWQLLQIFFPVVTESVPDFSLLSDL